MHGDQITILTTRPKKPDSGSKVRVPLHGYKRPRVDIPLRITSSRPSELPKGHLCVGTVVLEEEEHLKQLEDLLYSYAIRPDLGRSARRSQRLPIGLKAVGRELPGFSAVTIDISLHGVKLSCHGPVKQGQMLNLTLESDTGSVPDIPLKGRAVWSRENQQNKGYSVGVEFTDLNPEQTDLLKRYHTSLAGRLKGNVMHRQVSDGQLVVRAEEDPDPPG